MCGGQKQERYGNRAINKQIFMYKTILRLLSVAASYLAIVSVVLHSYPLVSNLCV